MQKVFKNPLEGALYMFDKGFKVFPLQPNTKVPIKGYSWKNWAKKANYKKVKDTGTANPTYNWALDCEGSGLSVLDVDNKNGKNGTESYNLLEAAYGELPKTFSVGTPNSGYHYYFLGPSKTTVDIIAAGIDTRGLGGCVVCPGSRIDNKSYEIIDDTAPVNLPLWIKHLIPVNKESSIKSEQLKDIILNQDHHVSKVIDYLINHAPESIQGEGGNRTLYQTACQVKNLGISDINLAKHLIAKHYDPRCIPSWLASHKDSWASTIHGAYKGSLEPAGSKTPEAEFQHIKQEDEGPRHISEYKGKAPVRQWIIKNWIPKNEISSLYGSGGSGKSLLALQMALAAASGTEFMGLEVKRPAAALCVFCEDSEEELHRRKEAVISDFTEDIEFKNIPLFLWPRVGKNNDLARINKSGNDVIEGSFMPNLKEALKDMPEGDKLLILDTLSDIYLGSENTREHVNKFIKTHVGSLLKEFNLTIIILAHPSRLGQSNKDMLSGSTAWENAVRNRLALFNHGEYEGVMVLKRIKSNYAKTGEELFISWEKGKFSAADIKALSKETVTMEQQDTLSAVAKWMADIDEIDITSLAKSIYSDPEMSHLFAGKSLRTVERYITQSLRYPKVIKDATFVFKIESKEGTNKKHWVSKNRGFLDETYTGGDSALG